MEGHHPIGPALQEKPPDTLNDLSSRALATAPLLVLYLATGLDYPVLCGARGHTQAGRWVLDCKELGGKVGGALSRGVDLCTLSRLFSSRNTCTLFVWAMRASVPVPP